MYYMVVRFESKGCEGWRPVDVCFKASSRVTRPLFASEEVALKEANTLAQSNSSYAYAVVPVGKLFRKQPPPPPPVVVEEIRL